MFAILCYATPVFFLGLMLKLVFAVWLNVLPPSGRSSFASDMQFQRLVSPTGFYIIDAFQLGDAPGVLVDVLRHAVLPALALGLLTAGVFIRLVRTNVISTYTSGYVEAARSRGVSEGRLLSKHALAPRNDPDHHGHGHADRAGYARRRGADRDHLRVEGSGIHAVPVPQAA